MGMYPFERFTEDAKQTLQFAQEEAERSHQSYIGTEHLLLGLLRLQSGTAHRVLQELGIELDSTRKMVATVIGRNERILIQRIIPTSRVKKVIEISFEEARRMGTNMVDSGHLLMALAIEGEGIAAHVLEDLGADTQSVVSAVRRALEVEGVDQRRFRRRLPGVSDVETLLRLFGVEHIADLLRARGLDVETLANQLLDPPREVRDLRRALIVLRAEMGATPVADTDKTAELEQEEAQLVIALQEAEEHWVETLTS